ncbi:MAG: MFS transporter [Pseudomonadota bacterium]
MVREILPLLSLLVGMVFLMLGGGLHNVIIPVRGQIEGFSPAGIGWIGTAFAVGFTLGCIIIPQLVRRAGHVRTFSTLTALLSVSVLLNGLYVETWWWVLLRALSGFCFAGCYMVAESWLNERVSNEFRGSMFSIYAITTFIAMGAGQYLLVLADAKETTLFMIGAILYALAVVPTAISKAASPAPLTKVNLDLFALFRNSPAAAVGAFLAGIISSTWNVFGAVFGQQVEMSPAGIATLLAVAMLGSILFQYPIGKLSDLIDRRYVMAGAGVVGIVFGAVLAWLTNLNTFGTLFYVCVVGYGGVIYSIYSLAIAHGNDHADPSEFVKVSSGLLILYGFGTMAGPLIAAQMMNIFGPAGVFNTTTLTHAAFASYALYRTFKNERVVEDERVDFQTLNTMRATPESYNLDPRSQADAYVLTEEGELPAMPPPVKVDLD